jgi:hypothetical protein
MVGDLSVGAQPAPIGPAFLEALAPRAKPTADERNEVRDSLRLCWRHVGGL